ncbi:LOW QUALITY PROTEIN: hypothetical protein ACHAW6_006934 [Cyclotella cf. meneghiniana]
MGVTQAVFDALKDLHVTEIDGQLTSEDLTKLTYELCNAAFTIPTRLGGGDHGHMGLVLPEREYVLISMGNASFDRPTYPRPCPITLSDDMKTRTREMAVHKAAQIKYQVLGVEQALHHLILRAVPKEWHKNKYTGVSHLSIINILSHLKTEGANLEDFDVEELNKKMNEAWSIDETPATYFQRMDEYEEQLVKAGIPAQPVLRLALFKAQLQATGEFDLEIDEWDRKTATSKTFANFRPYIQKKLFKLAKDKQRKKDRKAFKTFLMDSGATSHYTRPSDGLPIIGASRKRVMVANGATIQATAQAELPFPLTKQARVAEVLPDLKFNSLVSVGKLADSGYTTIFSPYDKGVSVYPSEGVDIIEHGRALIKGWRDDSSGLWRVGAEVDDHQNFMSDAPCEEFAEVMVKDFAGSVYDLPSTEAVIQYHHASLGFPTKSTLLKAVWHGSLVTFPGLNVLAINRYFPDSDETQKGHMRQHRQNVRSTKVKHVQVEDDDTDNENVEEISRPLQRQRDVYVKVYDATKCAMYTDQTGRFPVTSSQGHKYLMVAVELDGNYIDAEPMKARTTQELVKAYQAIWKRWEITGVIAPNWHVMDNEAPAEFKAAIKKNGCKVELTPVDMHRRNIAERAIQTFKSHLIAVIAGLDEKFPIHEWHRIIPQTLLTLNLLRPSNVSPNVSAYAHHHGCRLHQ